MNAITTNRQSRRMRLLCSGVSALTLALTAAPAAAQTQAVPGDAQCPVAGTEVTCSGALPGGFNVPDADRDRFNSLIIRNVTGPIDAQAADGVAIDFYNGSQPVSIVIDAPGLAITSRGATYPRGNFVVPSSSAIGVRARTSGDVSIASNADITIDADTIDYGAVELVAGLAAEMLQTGTATRDLLLRNSGDILIASDEGPNAFTTRVAGIWAGYSGIEGMNPAPQRGIRIGTGIIENSGTITVERGAGILTNDLNYGTLDVLNSGAINASGPSGDVFAYGINIEAGAASNFGGNRYQRVTVCNTGTIAIEDRGASPIGIYLEKHVGPRFDTVDSEPGTAINDGVIVQRNMEGLDFGAGMRLTQGLSLTVGNGGVANMPGSTLTAINNGTIDVASYGIDIQSNANRVVRNTGTITVTALRNFGIGVLYDFASPSGSDPTPYNPIGNLTRFDNSATGVIRVTGTGEPGNDVDNPGGVVIYGGDPLINNEGLISVTGTNAVGLEHVAAFQIFGSSGVPAIAGRVDATNSGTIEASGAGAIAFRVSRLYNSAADARDTILSNSGTIAAGGADADGILHRVAPREEDAGLPPVDPAVVNLGNATLTLTASSIVRGGGDTGAAIRFEGGATNMVANAGLIAATSGQAIVGGTGAEIVDNSGRIEGSITLGSGDDRIVARDGGIITGAVDGGAGNDRIGFDVASGTAAFTDRIASAVTGFELLEKTGAGVLALAAPVASRADLLGGALRTSGGLGAMSVNAAAGTTLEATGALVAVTLADGAALSPGGADAATLKLASLGLSGTSILRFDLGAPGVAGGDRNDLIEISGNLILDGLLDVNARPDFGAGAYRLINYGGALTDNGLTIGQAPNAAYTVQTSVAGQVNLLVSGLDDLSVQFWDDGDTGPDGSVDGGAGIWTAGRTNWTNVGGTANNAWAGNFAIFQTAGGEVTVDGEQAVAGMQFMAGGYRLSAGAGGALSLNATDTIVRVDPGISAEIALPLTGAGALVKRDAGTLILSGNNRHAGGTHVREGVLQVASDAALGAAAGGLTLDGGTLRAGGALTSARGITIGAGGGTIDTQTNTATLSGALTGSGMLAKAGSGTLTLSGNGASYAGTLRLDAGALALTGTLGGTVEAATGARLTGTGTLGNLVVSGTLAPGASIGTLEATGNIVFRSGSVYDLELAAAGGTDLLRASGTATLEGGTVRITALDPETGYADGRRYTFLTAAGGLTGAFAGLSESSAFLDFALGYDATSAFVDVQVIRTFPDVAETFNQREAGTALAALDRAAGSDGLAVHNALLLLDAAPARAAFDIASGEIYAVSLAGALRQAGADARRLLGQAHLGADEGWRLWGALNGFDGRTSSDGNGARFTQGQIGGMIGLDYRGRDNHWAAGFGGGYWDGNTHLAARSSHAAANGWQIGGYARAGDGGVGLSATVTGGYAEGRASVKRDIGFGALARTAVARLDLESWALAGELRYGLDAGGGWAAGPAARVIHAEGRLGGFAESGADSLNLSGGRDNDARRTRYGGGLFVRWNGGAGAVDLIALYVRGDGAPAEAALGMAGSPQDYRVRAAVPGRSGAELGISGRYRIASDVTIGGEIDATLANGDRGFAGQASLTWRF